MAFAAPNGMPCAQTAGASKAERKVMEMRKRGPSFNVGDDGEGGWRR